MVNGQGLADLPVAPYGQGDEYGQQAAYPCRGGSQRCRGAKERERAGGVGGDGDGVDFRERQQPVGKVETGTNTELAKTSGKITTNPAVCAVSAPRTVSATKAKIQLRAKPKAATTAMHATAPATPPRKRNPTRYPTALISPMMRTLRTAAATVRPGSTAEQATGIERIRAAPAAGAGGGAGSGG